MARPSADDRCRGRLARRFRSTAIGLRRAVAATLVVASGGLAVASDGALTGTVVDGDGRPLAAVRVVVQGPRPGLERATSTDLAGGYRVAGLAAGRYRASFDRSGFQWLEVRDVDVGTGTELVLSITLKATAGDESVLQTGGPIVEAWSTTDAVVRDGVSVAVLPAAGRRLVAVVPGAAPAVDDRWSDPSNVGLGDPSAPLRRAVDGLELADGASPGDGLPVGASAGWRGLRAGLPLAVPAADGGVLLLATTTPETELAGVVEVGWSDDGFAGADRPTPRGRAPWIGLDDGRHAGLVLGGGALDGRLGLLASAAVTEHHESLRLAVADRAGEVVQSHDRQRGTETQTGSLRLDWRPGSRSRFDLLLAAGEQHVGGDVSDLFVVASGEASEPGFDRSGDDLSVAVRYHGVVGREWFVSASAGHSVATTELRPWLLEPNLQDQTLDGRYSGGVGGGVFSGGAGFRPFSDRHELQRAGAALEVAGRRHLVRLGLDWRGVSARRGFEVIDPNPACLPVDEAAAVTEPSGRDWSGPGCVEGMAVDLAGARLRLADGEALLLLVDGSLAPRFDLDETALHVVDRWRPRPNLGIELGLRAAWLGLEGGAAAMARLSEGPLERLDLAAGLVWDPEGRGRSRVFARAARRHAPPAVDPDRGPLAVDTWQRVRLVGGQTTGASGRVAGVASPPTLGVVAGVRLPAQLELVAGADTEILGGLAVGVVARYHETRDELVRIVDPTTGAWWLAAGGDTLPFAADDGLPARVPALTRTTRAVEAHARKRLGDGWQAELSVVWSRSEGTAAAARGADLERLEGPVAVEPFRVSDLAGSRGPLPGERPWQVRGLASYTFAGDTVVGATAWWASGTPVERLGASASDLRLDQRPVTTGATGGRTPSTWEIDLRIAQPLNLGVGELELGLEVLNLFDRQASLRGDPRWSLLDEVGAAGLDPDAQRTEAGWGAATVRQRPRRVELGLRFRW